MGSVCTSDGGKEDFDLERASKADRYLDSYTPGDDPVADHVLREEKIGNY